MTPDPFAYSRAPLGKALFALLFKYRRYIDMAVRHDMAVNLETSDLRERFLAGTFPSPDWERDAYARASKRAGDLKRAMASSAKATLTFAMLGILIAVIGGSIHPRLDPDWGKVLSLTGGLLAGWATLFELGGYAETWKQQSLHELLRPVIFRAAFLPGLLFAVAGQVWL
jgi:hypothetical protein